jgi:hypothetical protein
MWLQKAWAANGATKWPAINAKYFTYRQHPQICTLWDTYNVAVYWKLRDVGNGQVEQSQFPPLGNRRGGLRCHWSCPVKLERQRGHYCCSTFCPSYGTPEIFPSHTLNISHAYGHT